MKQFFFLICVSLLLAGCSGEKVVKNENSFIAPEGIPTSIQNNIDSQRSQFISELRALVSRDTDSLLLLVDKSHSLPATYIPDDLVSLIEGRSYTINKNGLSLRTSAEASLHKMAAAARKDGITLLVSSSYRSYAYQKTVYERNVREMGEVAADRESAKPGTSQHQLGLALDFGSITDDFAQTPAGKWLYVHAGEWGWSLSFPDGYETVTGYRGECWHFRYIGPEACLFQKKWFGNIQQYMMLYIDAWKKEQDGIKN